MAWKAWKQEGYGTAKIRSYQNDNGHFVAWINLGGKTFEAQGSSRGRAVKTLKQVLKRAGL